MPVYVALNVIYREVYTFESRSECLYFSTTNTKNETEVIRHEDDLSFCTKQVMCIISHVGLHLNRGL